MNPTSNPCGQCQLGAPKPAHEINPQYAWSAGWCVKRTSDMTEGDPKLSRLIEAAQREINALVAAGEAPGGVRKLVADGILGPNTLRDWIKIVPIAQFSPLGIGFADAILALDENVRPMSTGAKPSADCKPHAIARPGNGAPPPPNGNDRIDDVPPPPPAPEKKAGFPLLPIVLLGGLVVVGLVASRRRRGRRG
jgi:hypothetical protein